MILDGSTMVNESGSSSNIENYKIAIIGNQHVGKTTILSRYKYETTDDSYAPTVGIDFLTKNVFLEDKTIRLIMWDTAGQERFKSLIPSYLKNANCVILTYDITEKSSFSALGKWLSDVKDNVVEGTFIILCGNKIDLNNKRVISKEEGEEFAKENNIAFAETSATTGQGIKDLKRSCPAVSHIINLIVLSSKKTFFVIKSIPTVGAYVSSVVSYLYRDKIVVLPTC